MAKNTGNYNLRKDDPEDFYDVGVVNDNLDKIDTALKQIDTTVKNKDLRNGKRCVDIFSENLSSSHDCWNKWCCVTGAAGEIENAPITDKSVWFEIFTGGLDEEHYNRGFQLAVGCYNMNRKIFIRYLHDSVWSEWFNIADGGNSDTVDGKHASDFAEKSHKHGKEDLPDTAAYSEYAWDSNKLNGKGYDNFVTSGVYHTDADLNNPSFNKAYIAVSNSAAVVPQTGVSNSGYWHIMFFPYSGTGGGSGTQIAMPFSGNKLYMRSANGGKWSEWSGFFSDKGGMIIESEEDDRSYKQLTLSANGMGYYRNRYYPGNSEDDYGAVDTGIRINIGDRGLTVEEYDIHNDENRDSYQTVTITGESVKYDSTGDFAHGGTISGFDIDGNENNFTNVNADTVDGKHASDFALSTHSHGSLNMGDGHIHLERTEYEESYGMTFGRGGVVINSEGITGIADEWYVENVVEISGFAKILADYFEGDNFSSNGADYAEYFEWLDGNANNEDRRGLFVTLDGEKIRPANADDDYILGVVSSKPSVIGDSHSKEWKGKYLTDIFGKKLAETVEIEEETDENGVVIPAHTEIRYILNPDYDSEKQYERRSERKEWAAVGMVGKLIIVDDGMCEVNGYCYPSSGGIASKSDSKTRYRVMSRIDDTHVKIVIV